MKTILKIATTILLLFFAFSINAQEVVKELTRKEKKALKKKKKQVSSSTQTKKGDCTSGDCKDGEGVFSYSDGTKYQGDWIKGLRHGSGKFYDSNNKLTKEGYWENDVFQGNGCISGDCQNGFGTEVFYRERYIGNWKNGEPNGQGTWINSDKSKIVGNWIDGFQRGVFEVFYADGTLAYREIWRDKGLLKVGCSSGDCENGWGTYAWQDGNWYEGNWKDGKQHGQGNLYWFNGNKYFGDWKNNLMDGIGTLIWKDSNIYKGEFKNGSMNGKGKEYSKDSVLIRTGTWIDDVYQTDGIGCIAGNCQNGTGTYLWEDGNRYEGEWKNSKMNGTGTLTLESGEIYHNGQWSNHEKVD